jgi:hypothetical protein
MQRNCLYSASRATDRSRKAKNARFSIGLPGRIAPAVTKSDAENDAKEIEASGRENQSKGNTEAEEEKAQPDARKITEQSRFANASRNTNFASPNAHSTRNCCAESFAAAGAEINRIRYRNRRRTGAINDRKIWLRKTAQFLVATFRRRAQPSVGLSISFGLGPGAD